MNKLVRPRSRPTLSKDLIVETALAVADAEGLAALSMRRVADELSVAPMSLYRHVKDREGLLVGMLDVVALAIPAVETGREPREEIFDILRGLRSAFRAHPWIVVVLASEGLASAHILPLMDQMFGALFRSGLTEEGAARAWMTLFPYLLGESLMAAKGEVTLAQQLVRSVDVERLPALGRLGGLKQRDEDREFETAVNQMLDSLLT